MVAGGPGLRVALYAHDAMGLGHLRRNLAIARALAESPLGASVLVVSGVQEAGALELPPHTDCLTLPSLAKEGDGRYRSRSLALGLGELTGLRARTIAAALEAFAPRLLIVDKRPLGVEGELAPALAALRRRGGTRCVLGLRDVLDEPAAVEREWRADRATEAVRAHFDAIWVYGDRALYDPLAEYPVTAGLADLASFTGYLAPRWQAPAPAAARAHRARLGIPEGRLLLCLLGGGQDGFPVAWSFAHARIPEDAVGVIVTGPFLPPDARRRLEAQADTHPRLRLIEFVKDVAPLVCSADRIVAMGGYNTVCEALAARKPLLVVPRVRPRSEQWIRAERLRALGLAEVLAPEALTPERITGWLAAALAPPDPSAIDLAGLERVPEQARALLATPAPARHRSRRAAWRGASA